MNVSNTATVIAPRPFVSLHRRTASMALAVAILFGAAHGAGAQPAMDATPLAPQPPARPPGCGSPPNVASTSPLTR